VHELLPKWYGGAVVNPRYFDLAPNETLTTLLVKSRHHAAALIGTVLEDLPSRWAWRATQTTGSYWKMPEDADRTLRFRGVVDPQAVRRERPLTISHGRRSPVLLF